MEDTQQQSALIAIDYGKTVIVQRVKIFNRVNCCGDRTKNLGVRISEELPVSSSQKFEQCQDFGASVLEGPT